MVNRSTPEAHLPLTAVAFEILVSLAEGPRHGYDILMDIDERTGATLTLHVGTLYRAVDRLLDEGLIEAAERPADAAKDDDARRRYFRLSKLGALVAVAEAERLARQVQTARARLLKRGSRP